MNIVYIDSGADIHNPMMHLMSSQMRAQAHTHSQQYVVSEQELQIMVDQYTPIDYDKITFELRAYRRVDSWEHVIFKKT